MMEELITEQANPRTRDIDERSTIEILRLMNEEDKLVAEAVGRELERIAAAVEVIVECLRRGGRLFYVGTGTSGRLGVLDAVECPPTFGVAPEKVQAILAGGYDACHRAVEAAEDDPMAGAAAIAERGVTAGDVVVGVTASGRTPFTLGALKAARSLGAITIGIACNPNPEIARVADLTITPVVGPEVIAGSTRLKAGTAQKMVLNMLSTAAMIKLGYTYGNLMSNLQLKNEKLRRRAISILRQEFALSEEEARRRLEETGWELKTLIVMLKTGTALEEARRALEESDFSIKRAIEKLTASA
ncbi:MAG: N-acetylmuramic acid 6-phosphate etherase [Blastocatellia bacterium]|nr:N-acetylmuramic acid 6-phosphate etherase [Blastocatellia bacterium]MCS7156381.1 N-acetylmuramic acid 6-phosphate etherase [Blastocatellia bacterium]MCX7751268.1 N-acetylmuramic acid 6-phosphate etherase [Blastocatellia bacterium]MDW8168980.1 N-acetylmuramic acid 6-phosphate etherase [Acidobacteriota bacterium]MDW8256740.1 N-acetylmuramic acid 6-phosphate etherase [Acidobacteriota bacterium]